MLNLQKLTPEQSFSRAVEEVDKVMTAYRLPQEELFNRYLNKNAEEKEAFVLALIGQASVNSARRI
jgi:hypothetical protein